MSQADDASSHNQWKGLLLWPLVVAVLFVLPSLNDGLVSDDYELIAEGTIRTSDHILEALTESGMAGFYRPVPRLLLGINRAIHGLHPFGYHFINALVHAAVVIVLVKLLSTVTAGTAVPLIAGVLFAGHFVHVEPVYWVSARNELLAALLYLAALLCIAREEKRLRIAALAVFFLALLTKETAVTLPFTVVLVTIYRIGGSYAERIRCGLRSGLPFAGVLGVYGLLRWSAGADWPWSSREVGFGIDPYLIVKNIEQYTVQLLVPVRSLMDLQSIDTYGTVTSAVRSDGSDAGIWPWLLLGAVLLIAGIWIAIRIGGNSAAAGLVFTATTALPFLFMDNTGLRYMYLPSAGFVLTVAACLTGLAGRWTDATQGEVIQWWLLRVIVCILLLLSLEQTRWWDEAGRLCASTVDRVLTHAATVPTGTGLYVFDIPRRLHGAYVFHNGFEEAVRMNNPGSSRSILDGERMLEQEGVLPDGIMIFRLNEPVAK